MMNFHLLFFVIQHTSSEVTVEKKLNIIAGVQERKTFQQSTMGKKCWEIYRCQKKIGYDVSVQWEVIIINDSQVL